MLLKWTTLADISEWYDSTTGQGEAVWIALTPPLADKSILGQAAAQTIYQPAYVYNYFTGHCEPDSFDDVHLLKHCDNFTQMMWASSDKAGIGVVQDCPGSMLCSTYVVMRFSPKG